MELLIGNDYYNELILPERKKLRPGLYLLASHLGWILSDRHENVRSFNVSFGWSFLSTISAILCPGEVKCPHETKLRRILETGNYRNQRYNLNDCDDDQAIQNFHC